jgi:hypothetical protein
MSGKKIEIIIRFLSLTALILSASLNPIHASGSTDIRDKNLLHQEKKSRSNQTAKVLEPKKIIIIGVPKGQESGIKPKERIDNKLSQKRFQWGQSCLTEKKTFKDRGEAEVYLECLLEERNVLEGDFYGINLTAYRYVNIFYRRGYVQHKIFKIDREIKRTKSAIRELGT